MIAWSIEAAVQSGCFQRIIVSTDDAEIAEVARSFGAEVPFLRPSDLAGDFTGTIPVIRHATEWCVQDGCDPQEVCCIYATAPFVDVTDLRRGMEVLIGSGCEYAFSVTDYSCPVQRALRLTSSGRVEMFYPEHVNSRSQDLESSYHDAGQFYWGNAAAWLGARPLFTRNAAAVVLPRWRVQDIDTMDDWIRAEWLFKALNATR